MSALEAAGTCKIPRSTFEDKISRESAQAVTLTKKSFSHESFERFVSKFLTYLSFSQ